MKNTNQIKYIKQLENRIKELEEMDRQNEINLLNAQMRNSRLLKMLVNERSKNHFALLRK